MDIINTNLSIKIDRLSNLKSKVTIQSFPQNNMGIENYKLVFDMKFRDDYESDFAGVCIGPAWENFGPGEFTIYLNASNNYKNNIIGDMRSAVFSPTFKKVIGIAMFKKPFWNVGTEFNINIDGVSTKGTVCNIPFV